MGGWGASSRPCCGGPWRGTTPRSGSTWPSTASPCGACSGHRARRRFCALYWLQGCSPRSTPAAGPRPRSTCSSPAYSEGGPPPGATAQCRDGLYGFNQSRRGTCSWHGGVLRWLY
ncbi:DUF3761 domain-containing protein [Calidithermus roseus]|uniref:DUF3761 domain-containing protein n=1 Tax=Calidithermus roseus TaxID=1644118 RepID=UPI001C716C6E